MPMEKTSGWFQDIGVDEQLWQALQEGDDKALKRLVDRYAGLAEGLCASYRAVGLEQDDLLQEAYLGLLKAIRSFCPEKGVPFSAFAGICMKRQLISVIRRQNAGKNCPLNDSVSLEETELTEALPDWRQPGPEAAVILAEESRWRKEQVVTLLSPLEKEALQLYLKGFSYEEMAKRLQCPKKSVDNALQRVRRKLQKARNHGNP